MIEMRFSDEVAEARTRGAALVALESTIITHGMPWPQNAETARRVEQDIRDAGAVPATIAVIAGVLHIGLEDAVLETLARASDVAKLSRADLAALPGPGRHRGDHGGGNDDRGARRRDRGLRHRRDRRRASRRGREL